MSETAARKRIVDTLTRGGLDGRAIENVAGVGTPDVNFRPTPRGSWIECKCLRSWPKRPETPVRLDHPLTLEQRIWLTVRAEAGEANHVVLQVQASQEWLVFEGGAAAEILGKATKADLLEAAVAHWKGREMEEKLVPFLLGGTL